MWGNGYCQLGPENTKVGEVCCGAWIGPLDDDLTGRPHPHLDK